MPVAGEASAGRLLIPSELWSMQIGMPAARPKREREQHRQRARNHAEAGALL